MKTEKEFYDSIGYHGIHDGGAYIKYVREYNSKSSRLSRIIRDGAIIITIVAIFALVLAVN